MATRRSNTVTASRNKTNDARKGEVQRLAKHRNRERERNTDDFRHFHPDLEDKYRQPNGLPTWHQWPGEPDVDYYHFQVYRDMGPHRTLTQARIVALGMTAEEAKQMKKTDPKGYDRLRSKKVGGSNYRRVRHRWGWEERVTLFDEWTYNRLSERVDDPELAKRMQLISLEEIREKAVTAIKSVPVHRLPPSMALLLVESAHRMERVVRGEPTDINKTVEGPNVDFTNLSNEELTVLLGLIEKAGGAPPVSEASPPSKKSR